MTVEPRLSAPGTLSAYVIPMIPRSRVWERDRCGRVGCVADRGAARGDTDVTATRPGPGTILAGHGDRLSLED